MAESKSMRCIRRSVLTIGLVLVAAITALFQRVFERTTTTEGQAHVVFESQASVAGESEDATELYPGVLTTNHEEFAAIRRSFQLLDIDWVCTSNNQGFLVHARKKDRLKAELVFETVRALQVFTRSDEGGLEIP